VHGDEHLTAHDQLMHCLLRSYPTAAETKRVFDITTGKPKLALLSDNEAVWVFDPSTNVLVASAWLAQVSATPARRMPESFWMSSAVVPVLVVCIPGFRRLTIGCLDLPANLLSIRARGRFRFSWYGSVQCEQKRPAYWVTGGEWLALVEKFGLTSQLEDRDVKRVKGYPWRTATADPSP
jgi:hypothetical protein